MGGEYVIAEQVYQAKQDSRAADELIGEYLPFIKTAAAKVTGRIPKEGQDDELSIAMMAFHEAIIGYSRTKGAFLKYASVVIRSRLVDYHRKMKRHLGQLSLDAPVGDTEQSSLLDTARDDVDRYEEIEMRDATRQEILELTNELRGLGLSLSDVADQCPKQERTLSACQKVLAYVRENPPLLAEIKKSGRLPAAELSQNTGVERKTLERHRKYIVALMVIYSNGYEMIRGHLKQVIRPQKAEVMA